jgi:hypothetical protein
MPPEQHPPVVVDDRLVPFSAAELAATLSHPSLGLPFAAFAPGLVSVYTAARCGIFLCVGDVLDRADQ